MRTKIAAGNWKMNGVSHSLEQLNELVKSQGNRGMRGCDLPAFRIAVSSCRDDP